MKNLRTKLSYAFYTLLVAVFISCEPSKQTLENFCGGVVYEKYQLVNNGKLLTILINDTITEVFVYRLDFQRYKLGDTINCN